MQLNATVGRSYRSQRFPAIADSCLPHELTYTTLDIQNCKVLKAGFQFRAATKALRGSTPGGPASELPEFDDHNYGEAVDVSRRENAEPDARRRMKASLRANACRDGRPCRKWCV